MLKFIVSRVCTSCPNLQRRLGEEVDKSKKKNLAQMATELLKTAKTVYLILYKIQHMQVRYFCIIVRLRLIDALDGEI